MYVYTLHLDRVIRDEFTLELIKKQITIILFSDFCHMKVSNKAGSTGVIKQLYRKPVVSKSIVNLDLVTLTLTLKERLSGRQRTCDFSAGVYW